VHIPYDEPATYLQCVCTRMCSCPVFPIFFVTKCVSPKFRGLPAASPNRVTNGSTNGPEAVTN
jgi:hypothetical protein